MKASTTSLAALALALTLAGCSSDRATQDSLTAAAAPPDDVTPAAVTPVQPPADALDALYADATRTLFGARGLSASLYGLGESEVGRYYADTLDDYEPAAEKAMRTQMRDLSNRIAAWPDTDLSPAQQVNRDIMANVTRYFAGNTAYPFGYIDTWMGLSPFIVNQINGPLIDTPRLLQDGHKISSERDAQDYLARLSDFGRLTTGIRAKLESDAQAGWIAPAVILQGALAYMERFTAATPAEHPLVTSFSERLAELDELDEAQRQALAARAADKVAKVVYPAYADIAKATRALLPEAPTEAGVWAQPGGQEYYLDAIRFLGDSELTADEIHAIGLAEVERITAQMNAILKAEGYPDGSVGQRMVALSEEERFLYQDSQAGRQALLADLNTLIEEITIKMAPWFKTSPPYSVEVRAYPEEIQDGMPGGEYQSPSVDGSKPGIYWINLRDMQGVPSFALKTLTYHEANPGHHWQVALNLAQDDFPFLRRISPYNAYAEGWALYSELVAAELGVYADDPYGDLGRLQDELFRAVRLVVDTGLHHKRWTREEAIAYMAEATGKAESEVVAEIERYMAWPGQALGYKLGMLKIQALRTRARDALGDDFDMAAFHDLLLLGGAMPMSLLEGRVDRWIQETGG